MKKLYVLVIATLMPILPSIAGEVFSPVITEGSPKHLHAKVITPGNGGINKNVNLAETQSVSPGMCPLDIVGSAAMGPFSLVSTAIYRMAGGTMYVFGDDEGPTLGTEAGKVMMSGSARMDDVTRRNCLSALRKTAKAISTGASKVAKFRQDLIDLQIRQLEESVAQVAK